MSNTLTYDNEAIICILNAGFTDAAMDAARQAGACGGTVIHGRGTASPAIEKSYGITVTPEKEIILIIASCEKRNAIQNALYQAIGQGTEGHGIVFSLPVDSVVGIKKKL